MTYPIDFRKLAFAKLEQCIPICKVAQYRYGVQMKKEPRF